MIGIAWVLVVILGLVPSLLREAHTDIAWPLYLANRILAGAHQGADFLEVNPPLFLALAIPPVLLERWVGIPTWPANVLLTGSLIALSLALTARMLSTLVPDRRARHMLMIVVGFAALVLPRLHFGQREHLAFVATVPWFVLAASRIEQHARSRGLALVVGLLGGIGFAIKPHFLVAWLLLEAFLALRLRWETLRRPELWALVTFGVAYLLLVLALVPDYVPMAFRLQPWYERYINNGLAGAIILADPLVLFAVVIVLAQRLTAHHEDSLTAVLALALMGFLTAAILQRKGFDYHYLAASAFALVAAVRGWQVLPRGAPWRPSLLVAKGGVVLASLFIVRGASDAMRELAAPASSRYRTDRSYPQLLPEVNRLARGKGIVVLSSNPASGWPLTLDAGATWASRYMSFWPLPALYNDQVWSSTGLVRPRPYSQRTGFERQFSDEVTADLERWQPRLVIVLEPDSTYRGWGGAQRFDYLEYFGSDPRFQLVMRHYTRSTSVGRYTIWERDAP